MLWGMATTPPKRIGLPPAGPPRHHGVTPGRDPVVQSYTAGIAARAKAAGKEQRGNVPIPDLGVAAATYRPEKDGPMSLGQIAESQENIRSMSNPTSNPEGRKASLRPETMEGLKALHEAATKVNTPPSEAKPVAAAEPVAEEDAPLPGTPKKGMKLNDDERQRLAEMSDLDFDLMMSRVRSDVINNEEEKKAIEARLKPLDLADGIVTGEFTQFVDIVPGKFEVVFRSLTPFENETIRRHVLGMILEEREYSQIHQDKYGFMQVVAALHSINGQELPSHLKKVANGREFMMDIFMKKYSRFTSYPVPMIHALSVHANWFDLRVRALFTTAALKNG